MKHKGPPPSVRSNAFVEPWWNERMRTLRMHMPPSPAIPRLDSVGWDPKEIHALYAELSQYVDEQCKAAGHKKPVFIVGENHASIKSLLIDLMMIDIVGKKLCTGRPAKHFLEATPEAFKVINATANAYKKTGQIEMGAPIASFLATHYLGEFRNFVPIATDHESSMEAITIARDTHKTYSGALNPLINKTLARRDKTIADNINDAGILITGTSHCRGIIEHLKSRENLHVACINTHQEALAEGGDALEAANFAKDPANMPQIHIHSGKGNIRVDKLQFPEHMSIIDDLFYVVQTAAKAMPHKPPSLTP